MIEGRGLDCSGSSSLGSFCEDCNEPLASLDVRNFLTRWGTVSW